MLSILRIQFIYEDISYWGCVGNESNKELNTVAIVSRYGIQLWISWDLKKSFCFTMCYLSSLFML